MSEEHGNSFQSRSRCSPKEGFEMSSSKSEIFQNGFLALLVAAGALFVAQLITNSPYSAALALALVLAVLGMVLTFTRPFVGLSILVFSMLLSPEIPVAQTASRSVTLRVDDLLIILIFFTWLARSAINKEMGAIRFSNIQVPVLGYVAMMVFSTLLGLLRGEGSLAVAFFFSLKYIEYVMIFLLVQNLVDTELQVRQLLKAFFVTGGLVMLFGYYQYLAQNQAPYAPFDIQEGVSEPASLAGYLILFSGVAWGLISERPVMGIGGGLITLWVMAAPLIFLTQSRASYMAFILMNVLAFALTRFRRVYLLLLLVGGSGLVFLFFPGVYEKARERTMYTFQKQTGPARNIGGRTFYLEESAEGRVVFWQRAFGYYLPKHPLIGHGVGQRPALEGQIPMVLFETGLIGLVFFFWILISAIRQGWRLARNGTNPLGRGLGVGFVLGLFGIFLQSLVNNTFIIIRIMEPFWLLLGLVTVLNRLQFPASERPSRR